MTENKIPVGQVVGTSLNYAWENFGALLRVGWFPLLGSGIFSVVGQLPPDSELRPLISPEIDLILIPISFFLSYLLWAVFAVAIHRMILLDEDAPPDLLYFRLSGQELRYSVAPLLISIVPIIIIVGSLALALGPEILFSMSGDETTGSADGNEESSQMSGATASLLFVAFLVGLPFAIFVAMRLTMVMPAIVDKGTLAFRYAWRISKGNVWRLIGVQFLLSFAFSILLAAFALLVAIIFLIASNTGLVVAGSGEMTGTVLGTIVTGVAFAFCVLFLGTVAGIAILSYSYQALTEGDELSLDQMGASGSE